MSEERRPAPDGSSADTLGERPEPASTTILVVDDEPYNVDILRIELEDRGFRVVCAEDGVEALERIAESPVDLALLDVMMPRMDGYELTRRLRTMEAGRELPIILLTAKGELGDKSEGFGKGADDYIVKPFHFDDVLARIEVQLRIAWHLQKRRKLESARTRVAMIGAAAHELAQPLSGACGYLQLLQAGLDRGLSEEDGIRTRLEQIRFCLDKTRQLADKMEGLERVELEDYACGLHIVNIHERPAAQEDAPHTLLVTDLTGGSDRALLGDLKRLGFRVLEEAELVAGSPAALDLVLLFTPDRPALVDERLRVLRLHLDKARLLPPSVLAVVPAPIGDGPPGLELMALGVDDVLARPFQLEELLLRMRSRIRLHRLRLQRIDAARLGAALDVSRLALIRMRPALALGEELLQGLEPAAADLGPRLEALALQFDILTATVRDLQARRLDESGGPAA
jgi:DNA-binding response OmpR family regulator